MTGHLCSLNCLLCPGNHRRELFISSANEIQPPDILPEDVVRRMRIRNTRVASLIVRMLPRPINLASTVACNSRPCKGSLVPKPGRFTACRRNQTAFQRVLGMRSRRTSSEIRAIGERNVRNSKGFRCRLSFLTRRGRRKQHQIASAPQNRGQFSWASAL